MVYGTLAAAELPLQTIARDRCRDADAIVDAGFNLRCFFVIVPGHQLQIGQLLSRVIQAVDFAEGLQPRLTALLLHDAIRAP